MGTKAGETDPGSSVIGCPKRETLHAKPGHLLLRDVTPGRTGFAMKKAKAMLIRIHGGRNRTSTGQSLNTSKICVCFSRNKALLSREPLAYSRWLLREHVRQCKHFPCLLILLFLKLHILHQKFITSADIIPHYLNAMPSIGRLMWIYPNFTKTVDSILGSMVFIGVQTA